MEDNLKSDTKEELYKIRVEGGVLLLVNSPESMQFGIDNQSWNIGPKFMGIKHIPLGPHFITYSLKSENYQTKQGFFIFVSESTKIFIRKWDPKYEDFVLFSQEEQENFEIGVKNFDFDQYLGPYPLENFDTWKEVSYSISKRSLDRFEPISKKYLTSAKEYNDENNEMTNELPIKSNIYFTDIIKKKFVHKMTPEEITQNSIDKSQQLMNLIEKEYENDQRLLFAEIQYSFVTFLLGEVYESFEQWKKFIILFFSCQKAVFEKTKLFCDFIELFYYQMKNFPKDFFHDEIYLNSFLSKVLENFITFCLDEKEKIEKKLYLRIFRFNEFLQEKFSFFVCSEEEKIISIYLNKLNIKDEDLPVIVQEDVY